MCGALILAEVENKKALHIDPKLKQANNNLGLVYYRKALGTEDSKEKRSLLKKSRDYYLNEIKNNEGYLIAYTNLSYTFFEMGLFLHGVRYLERAKTIDSKINISEHLNRLAEGFSIRGRTSEAAMMRKKAQEITSNRKKSEHR